LHVIPSVSLKHGGPSHAIKAFAKASKAAGIDVTVATTDDDGDRARLDVPLGPAIEHDGVTHFFFRRDVLPYKVSFGLQRWLNEHVKEFDAVHIHALFSFSSFVAARAARRHRIPYLVRPLGVLNRWGMENRRPFFKRLSFRLIELPILRRAAAVHYTTEAERKEANSLHPDLAHVPSFVIPIPVELAAQSDTSEEFFRQFPASDGKKLILFLSRIDEKKGIELLLQAFAKVRRTEPESLLVIAGSGNDEYVQALRQMSQALGIAGAVLWTGFLGKDQKPAAFAAASVFILPSHSENFGIAVAEALAAGVPTIITEGVGLSEEIRAAKAGVIVQSTSDDIAIALADLLGNTEKRDALSKVGRDFAKASFSIEAIGAALSKAYQTVAASNSPK
jgi:glycosyltransferase involved in cell wall biosynthesis